MDNKYMELELISERLKKAGVFPLNNRTILSAWMPSVLNGRLVESAFLYTAPNSPNGKMPRPFAWLTVDSQTGSVVRFEYCAVCDFMDTEKYPMDMKIEISVVPLKQRMAAGKKFKACYEGCRDIFFTPADKLTPEQNADLKELKQSMSGALRRELMDFYRVLGKTFFEWLEQTVGKEM
ncbi:MAG: hypothetical protein LUI87_10800 [Lachnospiraceae bacterium]|nr:hypothetical protein [Lachnospiraceae bacterium]